MPPWSWSISILRTSARDAHCSRRSPVAHASSRFRCLTSGWTFRTWQHSRRMSTAWYMRFGPWRFTSPSTAAVSGNRTSTWIPYRLRTFSMRSYVSCGRRPVSIVNTRTSSRIRTAMSRMAMPSAPPPSEIAIRGWNRSSAHSRTSWAGASSYRTESSPASYSSSTACSATSVTSSPSRARRRRGSRQFPARSLNSCRLASGRRRARGRQCLELLVGRPDAEVPERLALGPTRDPRPDQPVHGLLEPTRRDAANQRPGDRLEPPDAPPQEHVERLLGALDRLAARRSHEPDVADPVQGAGVRAAVEVHLERPQRVAPPFLEVRQQATHPALGLGHRVVAVRLAGARDGGGAERVCVDREPEVAERRDHRIGPRGRDVR